MSDDRSPVLPLPGAAARRPPGGTLPAGLTRRGCLLAALGAAAGRAAAAPAVAPAALPAVVPMALSVSLNLPFVDALLDELATALGIRWELVRVPFTRVVRMASDGSALGFGISPTPARNATLDFTQPLFESGVWALSPASAPREASAVAQLKGLSVCTTRDAQLGTAIDAAAAREFRALPAGGDFASRLRMLGAGRCEVLLATHFNHDRSQLQSRIRAAGVDPDQVFISREPMSRLPVHVAARRGEPLARWVPVLDQALEARRAAIAALLRTGP